MYNKKRVGFLLIITLFILLMAPSVFALIAEFLYGGGLELLEPVTLYKSSQFWRNAIHFFLFFFIISAIARTFVIFHWGENKEDKLKFFFVAVGLLGGLSLAFLFDQLNWSLLNFGWIFLILVIILLVLIVRALVKGEGKTEISIWSLIGFVVLALLIIELAFPQVHDYVQSNPLLSQVKGILMWLLLVAALIGLGKAFLFSGHGEENFGAPSLARSTLERLRRGWAPGPYETKASKQQMREDGGERGSGEKRWVKGDDIFVEVLINQPQEYYTPEDTVRLLAVVKKKGFFKKERIANYYFEWQVLGHPHLLKEEHTARITLPLNTIATTGDEEKEIVVTARDLDDARNQKETAGGGSRTIRLVSGLPEVKVYVDGEEKDRVVKKIGEKLNLKYEIQGPLPTNFKSVKWLYKKGVSGSKLTEKDFDDREELIGIDSEINLVIGGKPLERMKEGHYTIMAVALDKHDDPIPVGSSERILGGRITLEVKTGTPTTRITETRPTGRKPTVLGTPHAEYGEKTIEKEYTLYLMNKDKQILANAINKTTPKIEVTVGETYFLILASADIQDCELDLKIEPKKDNDKLRLIRKEGGLTGGLVINKPGTKTMTAYFMKGGEIIATPTIKLTAVQKKESEKTVKPSKYVDPKLLLHPELVIRIQNALRNPIAVARTNKRQGKVQMQPIKVGTILYFDAFSENLDIQNYEVRWKLEPEDTEDLNFVETSKKKTTWIKFTTPGNKTLTCTFYNGVIPVKTLTLIMKVE